MKKWATWSPEVTVSDYGLYTLQQRQFVMTVLYQMGATILNFFFISSCRRDVNSVFFVLGDSASSEFYVPTFRDTLSVLSSKVVRTRRITERNEVLVQISFKSKFTCLNTLATSSQLFFLFTPPLKMEQSVSKRRHIKFKRRRITQNKE